LLFVYDAADETCVVTLEKPSDKAKALAVKGASVLMQTFKKCTFCQKPAISGGQLCRNHNFCDSCQHDIPDGKYRGEGMRPLCADCAPASL
jgi:hypothetical protein